VDPFALLGVSPDVTADQLTAAYRRLAKQWHPDRQATAEAVWRMAQINAAYDAARAALAGRATGGASAGAPPAGAAPGRRPVLAPWLEPAMRRALGVELARALHEGEPVVLVAPTSTWASPQARLAVTDRRLLWLHEDAITDRVRSLRFDAIDDIDQRLAWPRRRTATLRIRDHHGRRTSFAELEPSTAAAVVGHVRRRRAA
jgi:hypothetical protein